MDPLIQQAELEVADEVLKRLTLSFKKFLQSGPAEVFIRGRYPQLRLLIIVQIAKVVAIKRLGKLHYPMPPSRSAFAQRGVPRLQRVDAVWRLRSRATRACPTKGRNST
jgi:hypothetical protein